MKLPPVYQQTILITTPPKDSKDVHDLTTKLVSRPNGKLLATVSLSPETSETSFSTPTRPKATRTEQCRVARVRSTAAKEQRAVAVAEVRSATAVSRQRAELAKTRDLAAWHKGRARAIAACKAAALNHPLAGWRRPASAVDNGSWATVAPSLKPKPPPPKRHKSRRGMLRLLHYDNSILGLEV